MSDRHTQFYSLKENWLRLHEKKSTRGCYGKVGNPKKNFYNNIKRMSSNFMLERRKRITHSEEFKEITLHIFPLPYKTVGRDIV